MLEKNRRIDKKYMSHLGPGGGGGSVRPFVIKPLKKHFCACHPYLYSSIYPDNKGNAFKMVR